MLHETYMSRCLQLAKQHLRIAAPNPSVGAVLVYKGQVIGEGTTQAFGGAHAEVMCINSVNEENKKYISQSTLYVSLEPCSHYGKTPPCADLIVSKKIPKVVIACTDPNPLVAGNGIAHLRKNGIEVTTNILEKEAITVNKRFFTFHLKKRPYITLKWAETNKGFFAPIQQQQFWISHPKTKIIVHQWRAQEVGILVGENTIDIDNPQLNVRLVDGQSPTRIIINTDKQLKDDANIFNDNGENLIFAFEDFNYNDNTTVFKLNKDKTVLSQIMTKLYSLNIQSILVEGGAFTIQQFIAANLWDEAKVIKGKQTLTKGISAPTILGKVIDQFENADDLITILSNNQWNG